MPGSCDWYWRAWEGHSEAVPVLKSFQKPWPDHRWDRHLQMCGLPVEGGEKSLHLSPNQQFAPVSQGEQPATLDSKPLSRAISLAQQNSLHLGKLAMHLSKMHGQNMLYWLLF